LVVPEVSALLCWLKVIHPPQVPTSSIHRTNPPPQGREAVFLRDRASTLSLRLHALKSRPCTLPPSQSPHQSSKYLCPEPFLDLVADKLTSTAVLFLNVELLSEFYYNFPRELDGRLGRGLEREQVERFAREDARVARHLDVVRRKELLEVVLGKMEGLRELEGGVGGRVGGKERRGERGWSLF